VNPKESIAKKQGISSDGRQTLYGVVVALYDAQTCFILLY